MMKLSKATPYDKQVKQEIYSRIQRGEWTEGDRIPAILGEDQFAARCRIIPFSAA
jgi:DNA-binding GntR family transcriptional regulator